MPRYFRYYKDDTLHALRSHVAAELINRKPVVCSFLRNRPKRSNGAQGASTRLSKQFIAKLKQLGL